MHRSQKSPVPAKRIQNIIEYMTYFVYKFAARGLYEKDKMTFTVLLALKIDMQTNKVKRKEFMTFIKGEDFAITKVTLTMNITLTWDILNLYTEVLSH